MIFSESLSHELRQALYVRAGATCECTATGCYHLGRCTAGLNFGQWAAETIAPDGEETLNDLVVLCLGCAEHKAQSLVD